MSHYSHLTQNQRYQISALVRSKISISEISRILNRHRSTIYRELKRNKGLRGYRPKQADKLSKRRKASNQSRLSLFFWSYVEHLLERYFSPEQIHHRLKLLGWKDVGSIESMYLYIYENKRLKGKLYTFLRNQKTYRKRALKGRDRRGQIANRTDISMRPVTVEFRNRFGDWEGDTMVGKSHKGVILTYVDRRSRLTKMASLPNRKAGLIAQTSIQLLRQHETLTLTFDNGKEFADHEVIGNKLNADIYFARPYHSWERGTNENTNGLIRQFFGKARRLDNIAPQEVERIENLLNNRPRKVLGYLTPYEVLAQNIHVALRI